jgi:hypothetical protein
MKLGLHITTLCKPSPSPLIDVCDLLSRWVFLKEENSQDHTYPVGLAYQGKDIVFRFIIEYSSLRDFGPY